uniref:Multidrug and toxin extrusion protein n=1 Tax=Strombidium rassoulzadegani TaxID=1082188 RepID=A0A7S3CJI4_9SPIT|mmetsp:Transcript_13222/g.22432  ORF Transcript_13222/g.22432 Transcript_13222/m.22432 type:complete len:493 (+) Transcript_13222:544-2022(+)
MIFYMAVQLINTYFIGHTNDATLIAGVGMGNMLINVLAFAVMQGLNGALETLISQSYGASQNAENGERYRKKMRQMCGTFYNRGRYVVTVIMVPIVLIFVYSDKILIAIKQDPEVSRIARRYVTIMIPGVWSMGQFDATKKFLSSQYKNRIPVWVQLGTTIIHLALSSLFVDQLKMRETGAALAMNVTYILNMLISDACIRLKQRTDFEDMVFWYDSSVYTDIGTYLKIGVPGMLMLCFEWWAFELLAIFTGLLGVEQLAAEVVIIQMVTFIFMLPLGISYSASALTGNYLGEGKIDLAKRFASLAVGLDVLLTTIIVAILGTFTDPISQLFTQEENVIAIIKQTLWVLLIYIWFDTIHGVQSGIIRGLGRQAYGSVYTLFCYYILGMPLALVLAFTAKMGIAGLWSGFSIACIILDVGFAMIISCPNWHEIAQKMRKAIEQGRPQTPEASNYRKNYMPKVRSSDHGQGEKLIQQEDSPDFNRAQKLNNLEN